MERRIITIFVSIIIFATIIISISTTTLPIIFGSNISYFNVSIVIGNNNASITWVNSSIFATPIEGSTTLISIVFNASDPNGIADIDYSSINVSVNRSGTTYRNDTGNCIEISNNGGNTSQIQCTITFQYYDPAGQWNLNITLSDTTGQFKANNATETTTYNQLYAMDLINIPLQFVGNPGQNDIQSTGTPPQIRNRGNGAYTKINITAYDLVKTGSSLIINPGNFTINATTDSATGQILINNTAVTLKDNTGANKALTTNTNVDLYTYLDIPNGVSGIYNSTRSWIVTVE